MKLKQFLKKVDARQLKKAKNYASKIRELEEEKDGRFIAYVDEGDLSHDVSVEIDPKTLEVHKYHCDCKEPGICLHIVAVMSRITTGKVAEQKSKVVKRIKKKKLNKVETLMLELDDRKILSWLEGELQNNKELLVKFDLHFGQSNLDISTKAILENYELSKKAILGRKKSIALTQLPQLLNLLKLYHEGVIDIVKDQLDNTDSLNAVIAIEEVCGMAYYSLQKYTTRIATYCKKLFVPLDLGIERLDKGKLSSLIKNPLFYKLSPELIFRLIRSCHTRLTKAQKQYVIDTIYTIYNKDGRLPFRDIALDYVEFITDIDALDTNITKLPLFSWDHKYNTKILERAVELEEYDFVLSSCEQLINANRGYYALPYVILCDQILVKTADVKRRKGLHEYAIQACPNLDSYKYLYEHDKKARPKLIKKLNLIRLMPDTKAFEQVLRLKFGMWILIKKYDSLLSKVQNGVGFWEATKYEDILVQNRKSKYLESLICFLDHIWSDAELSSCHEYLKKLIAQEYKKEEVLKIMGSCDVYQNVLSDLMDYLGFE